jgi:hypothetical protein
VREDETNVHGKNEDVTVNAVLDFTNFKLGDSDCGGTHN